MHSGNGMTGLLCKCMTCAGKRQQKLIALARKRHREDWNEAQRRFDEAEDALQEAQARLEGARETQRAILERVRLEESG